MMETSSIIFLLVSGAISFGLGRIFLHLRNKKRRRLAQERAAQTRRKQPPDIESRNKSKRKRQLQQLEKLEQKGGQQQR